MPLFSLHRLTSCLVPGTNWGPQLPFPPQIALKYIFFGWEENSRFLGLGYLKEEIANPVDWDCILIIR